ncbi:hypothetical protein ACFSC3_19235 [Sphingomonas floccifaciens]|uniref:Uncharacterized protein n=1 Tax=Sphingomonas floccifaciens TaxID=1844115 RepID=A0ABW4NHT7_9SPHN
MSAPTSASEAHSFIAVLHARYEATFDEYNVVDRAATRLNRKDNATLPMQCACDRAMRAIERESDALRQAILYQLPTNWTDALILHHHIRIAQDLVVNSDKPVEADKDALDAAVDTLLDFMASTITADHDTIGRQFTTAVAIVTERRRMRTGAVEAVA